MGRFVLACKAFWQILTNADRADHWRQIAGREVSDTTVPAPRLPGADAVFALALLQREGRLVDFLREEIEVYDDAQVGAAVRQIHAGCRRAMAESFPLEPVLPGDEGATVQVPAGFDASAIRLTGRVDGPPPYSGVLRHRGWRVTRVDLPARHASLDPTVVAPAEVEVG